MDKSKVYFTKDISSNGLIKIYDAMKRELKGPVAVKISTGELGGHNYLDPNLIKDLVAKVGGTIVECNTAYPGKRMKSEDHWETIKQHGFLDITPVDIMDEEGEISIPVTNGNHLKGEDIVGSHIQNYNSMLVLSHFKGHAMGGFGGALKNISIGVASSKGKAWIHSVGRTKDVSKLWDYVEDQDGFLESMAEASSGVLNYFGKNNMAFINVANKISIDCDCDSNPKDPEMADIGIFASLDPVSLDKCCYDTIMNSSDSHRYSLIERMEEKHAIHTVNTANKLGVGNLEYELIDIDK